MLVHFQRTSTYLNLRLETIDVFYHGYDNYMAHGFPEDELKPVSCAPLTRDRKNPAHIEVNDVLGNYSLTLIDSLSTLAILASSQDAERLGRSPLHDFQDGVKALVNLYGDGSAGPKGVGTRNRGFDLDSKVQVFETVIRGVGGLVSAHLFATGELPISGYEPHPVVASDKHRHEGHQEDIEWKNGFKYNGQLLRLATDLAKRLLPAFSSVTGLPYPRVNLRHGIPFYTNSPLNAGQGQCKMDSSSEVEITETCSAGAGSLVLEFTTLSRLTGDSRYEQAAKRAFWAVWERRTPLDLIGAGIDAESGDWVAPFSGIGAGIDSFFEYAFKSHILLSGAGGIQPINATTTDDDFLSVWLDAHAGIKRHLFRGSSYQHPHYIQGDLNTGAVRAFWMDSLSAYYPGLLTLAGQVDEAISTHLLYTALWTRYAALPERWSVASGIIDAGLRWWGGRPEFIESTWYLYRATQDLWYLHVGEMVLRDIKRRCWTECGWAGLEDVRTGELKDRMESFFLGETVKYLYLLFDPAHPLNKLDAPFVFTTEGHPLIIPESTRQSQDKSSVLRMSTEMAKITAASVCPSPPPLVPFSISNITSRKDFFHAASLARLHQLPTPGNFHPQIVESAYSYITLSQNVDLSPTRYLFYPWNIPSQYVPTNGTSSKMQARATFDLTFNTGKGFIPGLMQLERIDRGLMINSINGIRLGMVQESEVFADAKVIEIFRVHSVGQISLGRDEEVYIPSEVLAELNPADPYFTRRRDIEYVDLVIDDGPPKSRPAQAAPQPSKSNNGTQVFSMAGVDQNSLNAEQGSILNLLMQQFSSAFENGQFQFSTILNGGAQTLATQDLERPVFAASVSTGIGAAPLPDVTDAQLSRDEPLLWNTIYMTDEVCDTTLPHDVPRNNQIIVMKRGGCTFAEKLRNIPSFFPSKTSLQLVIVVSYPSPETEGPHLIRPLLDEQQQTPSGILRWHQIPMIMVDGGDEAYEMLSNARSLGFRRKYWFESQGLRIANLFVV